MKSICVFASSNLGNNIRHQQAAVVLGKEIAKRQINLIYGGGRGGLMGLMADSVLQHGGSVVGVITHLLYKIEGHDKLTKLYKTDTMQERKKLMSELSDGFLVLPGGLGTQDEFFEIWNEAKLQIHKKPIGLLDIDNFYSGLMRFIDHTVAEGYCTEQNNALIKYEDNIVVLLDALVSAMTN